MAESIIDLTEAEWTVMECLWAASPLTGRELTERLGKQVGWSRSTTLTLLRRLEAKGAVGGDGEAGVKRFRPLLRREDAALRETEAMLGRLYHGSLSLLVSAMTRKQSLPQAEIDRLYALLKDMEGDGHA